jgi:hypothetical protein
MEETTIITNEFDLEKCARNNTINQSPKLGQ